MRFHPNWTQMEGSTAMTILVYLAHVLVHCNNDPYDMESITKVVEESPKNSIAYTKNKPLGLPYKGRTQ